MLFDDYFEFEAKRSIYLGNNHVVEVYGQGILKFRTDEGIKLIVLNALYAPDMKVNLASGESLVKDDGKMWIEEHDVQFYHHMKLFMTAVMDSKMRLWQLQATPQLQGQDGPKQIELADELAVIREEEDKTRFISNAQIKANVANYRALAVRLKGKAGSRAGSVR